jgi:hypothetical protein
MSSGERVSDLLSQKYAADDYQLSRWGRVIPYPRDTALLNLLRRIDAERSRSRMEDTNSNWLLKYRTEIRNAISSGSIDTIRLYLCRCPSEMVPVCVWLWGKCVDRFRLYGLSRFCHSSSQQVRRHVAKTLRRVEAWALLDEMAVAYPDDTRIRWYATAPTTHRPFTKRLKKFTANVDDSHADEVHTPSQMPYWTSEETWERTPPKSLDLIRRILRRIQHWVHWGVS